MYSSGGLRFAGCVYNVNYNDVRVSLWQMILSKNSMSTCCKRPSNIPTPPTVPGVTFSGFGYIVYNPRLGLSVVGSAQISFQFRTFSPDGVMLLVGMPTINDYYSINMQVGRVTMSILAAGVPISLSTTGIYNNGVWCMV